MVLIAERKIPDQLLDKILAELGLVLPHYCRGIKITNHLIKAALECLNEAPLKTLPQNCRQLKKENTPDGLDFRIKIRMGFDLRTANIISDVLESAGIVKVVYLRIQKPGGV